MAAEFRYLGSAAPRKEDERLLTGRGRYVDETGSPAGRG